MNHRASKAGSTCVADVRVCIRPFAQALSWNFVEIRAVYAGHRGMGFCRKESNGGSAWILTCMLEIYRF